MKPFTQTQIDLLTRNGWEVSDNQMDANKDWFRVSPSIYLYKYVLYTWMLDDDIYSSGGYWEDSLYDTLEEIIEATKHS